MTGERSDPRPLAGALHPRLVAVYRLLQQDSVTSGMSRTALSVLAHLRANGPTRISALAAAERVAQPSMTALVGRLERHDLVGRIGDPSDRRAVVVRLSETGAARLEQLSRDSERRLVARITTLDPEHRAALAAALPALDQLTAADSGGEVREHVRIGASR